jgi:hypothetical protein
MSDNFFLNLSTKFIAKRAVQRKAGAAIETAVSLPDAAVAAIDFLKKSQTWSHLNADGRRAERNRVLQSQFRALARLKLEAKRLRAEIGASIPKLPALAKDDIVGHMMDREARDIVRAMPQEQRDCLSRLDPALAAAVVRAPPELSGVSPSVHEMLRNELIAEAHPEQIAGLGQDTEALKWVDEAIRSAEKALNDTAEFAHEGERRQYVEQIEATVAAENQHEDAARKAKEDDETLEQLVARYKEAPNQKRHELVDRLIKENVDDMLGDAA